MLSIQPFNSPDFFFMSFSQTYPFCLFVLLPSVFTLPKQIVTDNATAFSAVNILSENFFAK